ncbi:MAG: GtrA family protein [Actinobacteria bacterium]|nr:GtrA family protein [Actinomycetota bacterium]MBM3698197.1 GtrA family protein [Actinomycetota bacterium]
MGVRRAQRNGAGALIASPTVPADKTSASARFPLALLRIPDLRRVPRADWMQLLRFLAVGASGYVVNLLVFWISTTAGAHYIPAAIIAFAVAWLNNFLLNRHWTFRRADKAIVAQGVRYLLVCLVALGANLLVLHVLVDAGLVELHSQAIAIVLVTPLNYLLSRRWSFR